MPAQLNFAEQTHHRWDSTGELSSWDHESSFSAMLAQLNISKIWSAANLTGELARALSL